MYPILLEMPALGVRVLSSSALVLVGYGVAFWLATRLGETLAGIDARTSRWACLVLVLVALVGGRFAFALNHADHITDVFPGALAIWRGGRHAPGSIAALLVAAPFVLRRARIPFWRFADCGTVGVAVGLALARLGCLLHGCCVGVPCDWLWCVGYPPTAPIYNMQAPQGLLAPGALRSLPVHPLPAYFGMVALAVAVGARMAWRHRRYDGQITLIATAAFGATSAALELLRHGYAGRPYWGSMPRLFWMGMCIAVAAMACLVVAEALQGRAEKRAWRLSGSAAAGTASSAAARSRPPDTARASRDPLPARRRRSAGRA